MQVGYGLANDLWAIAAAIGAEGAGCVAVVQPQVDVARVHRELRHRQALDISKVPGLACWVTPAPACVTDASMPLPLTQLRVLAWVSGH